MILENGFLTFKPEADGRSVDIISMVKKITKYSKMIKNPEDIPKELQKAFKISVTGRKGPVWIDVPVNVLIN